MNALNQSAFLKALGWSLLDSFWQMGILWLLYIVLTRNGKKLQSPQRHTLALLSLAAGSLWFLITLILHFNQVVNTTAITVYVNNPTSGNALSLTSLIGLLEPLLPFLSVAYLSAIIYLFIRLYRQYHVTQKLFSTGIYKANPELRVFLQRIAAQMGLKKTVRIWLSDLVDTPLTVGFLKPIILLPVAVINHLSLPQAEAIILHELNHIRRNDYLINLLISCMDIILFFNPFVRILTHVIKNERENSCDDMVLQFRYDASQYAKALLLLEKNRMDTPALTMAATGKSKKLLLKRVERILNKKTTGTPISQKLIACFLSALLIGFIGWYNPGRVIVKTIDTIEHLNYAADEKSINGSSSDVIESGLHSKLVISKRSKSNQSGPRVATEIKHQENTLEQALEWITESEPSESLEAMTVNSFDNYEEPSSVSTYIAAQREAREYSIAENVIAAAPDYRAEMHPYVPSTSFSYHTLEDTALPKKYIPTQTEIKAKEAMSAAIKALQEINWPKLEKEMAAAGKKIDIIKLQQELKKAMIDVDWKKINEDIQSSLIQEENEILREHTALRSELEKFQQERSSKLAHQQKIQKIIVQERLCEEKVKEEKPEKKKTVQKKKTVYI